MEETKAIYRFMSFQSFVDLVQFKRLTFVRPDSWEDPYENFMMKKLKTIEGKKEILSECSKIKKIEHPSIVLLSFVMSRIIYYAQCWTKYSQTDALWRIYNYNNMTIRIGVLKNKIESVPDIKMHQVKYVKDFPVNNCINSMIDNDSDDIMIDESLLYKREAFSHEGEVRLLSVSGDIGRLLYNSQSLIKSKDWTYDKEFEEFDSLINAMFEESKIVNVKDVKYIDIHNSSEFIDSVMLHPLAPDWFDSTLREYCRVNNINYIGKSKLYELQ